VLASNHCQITPPIASLGKSTESAQEQFVAVVAIGFPLDEHAGFGSVGRGGIAAARFARHPSPKPGEPSLVQLEWSGPLGGSDRIDSGVAWPGRSAS